MSNSQVPADAHLSLVVRSGEGKEATERRILDVSEMTTDAEMVRAAARAADLGVGLRLGEDDEVPVFDLRAATVGEWSSDSGAPERAGGAEAAGGCLVIGTRGAMRVALLVD